MRRPPHLNYTEVDTLSCSSVNILLYVILVIDPHPARIFSKKNKCTITRIHFDNPKCVRARICTIKITIIIDKNYFYQLPVSF